MLKSQAERKPSKGLKVLLLGAYGAGNLGDDILLDVMFRHLRSLGAKVTANARSPEYLRQRYPDITVFPTNILHAPLFFLREFWKSQIIVYGGGWLICESSSFIKIEPLMKLFCINLAAKLTGKKVFLLAVGADKISGLLPRTIARTALNWAESITTRDPESAQIIEDLGVKIPIKATADLGFSFDIKPPVLSSSESFDVGISLTPYLKKDFSYIAGEVIEFLDQKQTAVITLLPLHISDQSLLKKLYNLLKPNFKVRFLPIIQLQNTSIFGQFDLIIAARYHANLLTLLYQVPLIAIPYKSKVRNLMRQAGLENFIWETGQREKEILTKLVKRRQTDKIDISKISSLKAAAQENYSFL